MELAKEKRLSLYVGVSLSLYLVLEGRHLDI